MWIESLTIKESQIKNLISCKHDPTFTYSALVNAPQKIYSHLLQLCQTSEPIVYIAVLWNVKIRKTENFAVKILKRAYLYGFCIKKYKYSPLKAMTSELWVMRNSFITCASEKRLSESRKYACNKTFFALCSSCVRKEVVNGECEQQYSSYFSFNAARSGSFLLVPRKVTNNN